MPPKKKPTSDERSLLKDKRGRPRKFVDPNVLTPFERRSAAKRKNVTIQEKAATLEKEDAEKKRQNPITSDRNYSLDEVEFMNALAEFKRTSGRTFPTCSEILELLRSLGYEKVSDFNE